MVIKKEILDDLLKDCKNPEDLLGEEGVFKQLKKALLERALNAELDDHLGYEKGDRKGRNKKNSRNGHGSKRLIGEDGEMELSTPRDRDATFNPQIIKKGQKRFDGFDGKIISMYARGMVIPFFAYPAEVRKIIYTTNAIESLNMSLRKIIKNRGHFPSDDAATKLLYLALRNTAKKWTMPPRTWKQALNQFAILFEDRFPSSIY